MDARLEARALTMLGEALEIPEASRDAWLTERCGDDPALKARVAQLLRVGAEARLRTGAAPLLAGAEALPERIGAYRITGLIGQGGMGAVYRGERASGDFEHQAAIKLIRPGALSQALVERFRRERQTLARLAHPHIARLFDGGETPEGQPYLVMELIDGAPLDAWLAAERPKLHARLALFVKVCGAVAHAHRNLIIHRDLTPANILVDRQGEPKLIDFGIARPLGAEGAAAPAQTATPGFAAPERLAGAPATTLTDIYALGKLLDLLTGDEEDAELRAIARRASAPEPELRYGSADALADDVERWLSGRTVAAMGRGRGYAIRKFVARNRAGVTAAAGAALLIVAALIVSLVALASAERARAAEAARFAELRSLAGYMLFDLNDRLRRVPGNVAARASLAEEAQRYLSGLAGGADTPPALRLEIVDGLLELARVQGSPIEPNLGEGEPAQANLKRAEAELARLEAEIGATPAVLRRQAGLRALLGMVQLHALKDAKASEATLAEAVAALEKIPAGGRDSAWHETRRFVRRARLEFFDLEERIDELDRERQALVADMRQWPAALRASPAAAIDRGHAAYYAGIAGLVREEGDFGLAAFRTALARYEAAYAQDARPSTLYLMAWSAFLGFEAAQASGDAATAGRLVMRARELALKLRALDPEDDASFVLARNAEEGYAQNLANQGRFAEALAAHRRVVDENAARLASGGGLGIDLAYSQMLMGVTARKAGDRALACESWAAAERRYAEIDAKGKLLGFFEGFRPGLRANLARCAAGAGVASFTELR